MNLAEKTTRSVGRPADAELQERRRSQILEAATFVFAERSFADADVQEIATKIGIGKGTIYRYFSSKEELFLAAVDYGMRNLKSAVDSAADSSNRPLERIAAGVLAYLTFFDDHPEIVELLVQERAYFRDRKKPTYFVHRDANLGPWRDLFRDLIRAGVVRELSVEQITEFISDLLYGMMFTNYFAGRKSTPAVQCRNALEVLFRGILADSKGAADV